MPTEIKRLRAQDIEVGMFCVDSLEGEHFWITFVEPQGENLIEIGFSDHYALTYDSDESLNWFVVFEEDEVPL